MTFTKLLGKTCGFAGYVLQYACLTHCTFEYIGDFVMCPSGSTMIRTCACLYHLCNIMEAMKIFEFEKKKLLNIGAFSLDKSMTENIENNKPVTVVFFEITKTFDMCSGPSMEPTLESNNILFTEHISPRLQRLRRGDIVIAKSPSNPKQNICKRIIGLPGDRVRGNFPRFHQVVPRGHVWLEGDNSSNSADSRVYGPVPQALIRSRVVCRVWPLDKIASLTDY